MNREDYLDKLDSELTTDEHIKKLFHFAVALLFVIYIVSFIFLDNIYLNIISGIGIILFHPLIKRLTEKIDEKQKEFDFE